MCIGSASDEDLQFGTDANAILQLSTAAAPKLILCRDDTSITTNDYLGIIDFHSRDGGIKKVARIGARAGGNHGADDGPTDLVFHTMGDNTATTAEERLRITYDGNVGIGTDTLGDKLVVHQGSDDDIIVRVNGADSTTEFAALGVGAGYASFVAGGSGTTNTDMVLMTTSGGTEAEKLRITSTGQVGVGHTNPRGQFVINSTKNALVNANCNDPHHFHLSLKNEDENNTAIGLCFSHDATVDRVGAAIIHNRSGNGSVGDLRFYTCATEGTTSERLRITSDGKVGIGTTIPSSKLHIAEGSGNAKFFIQRSNTAADTDDYGSIVF